MQAAFFFIIISCANFARINIYPDNFPKIKKDHPLFPEESFVLSIFADITHRDQIATYMEIHTQDIMYPPLSFSQINAALNVQCWSFQNAAISVLPPNISTHASEPILLGSPSRQFVY
jgi:hypothetical protein